MKTLAQRLGEEARICATCGYEIADPFTERCPRCMTAVAVVDPGCGACFHSSACPVSGSAPVKPPSPVKPGGFTSLD